MKVFRSIVWFLSVVAASVSVASAQCPGVADDNDLQDTITIIKGTNGGRDPADYSLYIEYKYTVTKDWQAELWYFRTEYVWDEPREVWACSPTRANCSPEQNGKVILSNFLTPFQSHNRTTVTLRLVVPVD